MHSEIIHFVCVCVRSYKYRKCNFTFPCRVDGINMWVNLYVRRSWWWWWCECLNKLICRQSTIAYKFAHNYGCHRATMKRCAFQLSTPVRQFRAQNLRRLSHSGDGVSILLSLSLGSHYTRPKPLIFREKQQITTKFLRFKQPIS
jgi:hypothetical protein